MRKCYVIKNVDNEYLAAYDHDKEQLYFTDLLSMALKYHTKKAATDIYLSIEHNANLEVLEIEE